MNKEKLKQYINDDEVFKKINTYVELILEKNKQFNLTNFDYSSIWTEGIYQSIYLLNQFINFKNQTVQLLDIGAGAGFPSIPFYIFSKDKIYLTIYEPIKKRVDFLNLIKEKLNLKNLTIMNKRIEDSNEIESFNYICARAVMSLNMLIEVSSKCGQIGCQYVFLKSKNVYNEIQNSDWIIKQLKINDLKVTKIDINDNKEHNVVTYTKSVSTPIKFPRKWVEIKKGKIKINND